MMLTSREYSMLLSLMSLERLKISTLAVYYGVTVRVIYYNIENIGKYIKERKEKIVLHMEDGWIWIQNTFPEDFQKDTFINEILDDAGYHIILSQEERQLEILYCLLTDESIKIPDLIERFSVSKTTIMKDLEMVKGFLKDHGVEVASSSNKVLLAEDELMLRSVATEYMVLLLNVNDAFYRMLQESYIWKFRPYHLYIDCLSGISFSWLAHLIEESTSGIDIPYKMFCNCLCGIMISLIRDSKGYICKIEADPMEALQSMNVFHAAQSLIEKMNYFFSFREQKSLAAFVALLALGATGDIGFQLYLAKKIDFQIIASSFVFEVCELTKLNSGKKLIEDIQLEIYRICISGSEVYENDNQDIAQMLKNDYQELWTAVERGGHVLEGLIHRELTQGQLASLVLNFVDSYDIQKQKAAASKVLIVCNGSIVSSRLICKKLQSMFRVNVSGCVSIYEMDNFLENHDVDYIITTVPILERNFKVIHVNTYLSKSDLEQLKRLFPIRQIHHALLEEIFSAVKENGYLKDKEKIIESFSGILGELVPERHLYTAPGINTIIDRKNVYLDYDCNNLSDAVRISGNFLLESGYIDEIYVKEIVENIERAPEYMVIGEGVLMPHSRAAEHVFKTSVSVIRLKNPIYLKSKGISEIRWIFTLATVNHTEHITALTQLSRIVGEKEMLLELEQIDSAENFKKLLDKFVSIINFKEKRGDIID